MYLVVEGEVLGQVVLRVLPPLRLVLLVVRRRHRLVGFVHRLLRINSCKKPVLYAVLLHVQEDLAHFI